VERQDEVAPRAEVELLQDVRAPDGEREVGAQRVDHAVPDDGHAPPDVLLSQVVARGRRWGEEQVGQLVRDDPVDFLGHRLVERADARLDVAQHPPELVREERAGHGRVRVAVDEDEVRPHGDARDVPHRRRDLQVRRLVLQRELVIRLA